jgi:hypothetical protein
VIKNTIISGLFLALAAGTAAAQSLPVAATGVANTSSPAALNLSYSECKKIEGARNSAHEAERNSPVRYSTIRENADKNVAKVLKSIGADLAKAAPYCLQQHGLKIP